jgi:hypothetical protein
MLLDSWLARVESGREVALRDLCRWARNSRDISGQHESRVSRQVQTLRFRSVARFLGITLVAPRGGRRGVLASMSAREERFGVRPAAAALSDDQHQIRRAAEQFVYGGGDSSPLRSLRRQPHARSARLGAWSELAGR